MSKLLVMTVSVFFLPAVCRAQTPSAGIEAQSSSMARIFTQAMGAPISELLPIAAFRIESMSTSDDQMLRLLRDPDPDIRAAAAKALRERVVFSSRVRDALMDVAEDDKVERVRREAIKSLSRVAQYSRVKSLLLDIAQEEKESEDLRTLSIKALYPTAGENYMASKLVDALRDDDNPPEIRKAAAWALFPATSRMWVRSALLDYVDDLDEDESLRIECMKSLFVATADQSYVRENIKDIARDFFDRQTEDIKVAAIRTLQAANDHYNIRDFLENIIRREENPRLRMAAVKALGPIDLEAVRYFHLCYYQGKFIDPLEDE